MGRGDAPTPNATTIHHTTKAAPRIRNKVTHKTRLRIVHGDVEADRIFGEDEVHDGKSLATGVDAEDANEYHLLAVLKATQQQHSATSSSTFCQPSASNNKKTTLVPPAPPPPVAYIPTPDATGKVDNYADFYPEQPAQQSSLLAKASETLEEAQADCLAGGFAYVMDERDADWLDRNNKLATGEGPSTANSATSRGSRSAKAKGKEPEIPATVVISEDDFELVMGLFEKLTDEKSPFLHLSPSEFPPFADYDTFFSAPLPPHFFPTYIVPPSVPDPPTLYKYARIIYPYWRERKLDRGGRHIIPQLNYDESNESDPYVCFRRRMPKPLRKTRRQDPTQLDRLSRLSDELQKVLSLANMTLQREQMKLAHTTEARTVCEARVRLIDIKRKAIAAGAAGAFLANTHDEELLVEPIHTFAGTSVRGRKQNNDQQLPGPQSGQTIRLRPRARDDVPLSAGGASAGGSGMVGSVMLPTELYHTCLKRLSEIQHVLDREVARRKDGGWEDVTDNAFVPVPTPLSLRHFRSALTLSSPEESSLSPSSSSESSPSPSTSRGSSSSSARSGETAFRLRRGRGGRTMLDRRSTPNQSQPINLTTSKPVPPPHQSLPSSIGRSNKASSALAIADCLRWQTEKDSETPLSDEEKERLWRLQEKWRYDTEGGLVVGGSGVVERLGDGEDPRFILDDFEHSTFLVRKQLLHEEDFSLLLRTDDTILRRAELYYETRREAERNAAAISLEKAAQMRRDMAARQPPPPAPPPTPAAVQIKKQQEKAAVAASQANGSQVTARASSRAPHPLATSTTPGQSSAMDIDSDPGESSVAGTAGMSNPASNGTAPLPTASAPVNTPAIPNGVAQPNGTPATNGMSYLAPHQAGQTVQSTAGHQSSSPMIPEQQNVAAVSSSPTPGPRAASPAKPSSSSQPQPLPNGIGANSVAMMANAANGFSMQPNGMGSLGMSPYGMMPMMPNGYPLMNGGAGNPNVNAAAAAAAAAFGNSPAAMAQMQMQMQRMASANAMANGGTQLLSNGGANGMTNGMTNGIPSHQQLTAAQQQQIAMMGLKNVNLNGTVFAQHNAMNGMSTPHSLLNGNTNVNGLGQQPLQQAAFHQMNLNMMAGMNGNGMPMNLGLNGSSQAVQNFNLALGSGNIPLKLPNQRAMQWAAANPAMMKGPADGTGMLNGANGMLAPNHTSPQRQQNSSSPAPSASPASAARLNGGVGAVLNRNSPRMQAATIVGGRASPSGLRPGTTPSPRMAPAAQVGHVPSPLAASQQALGQSKLNGF